MLVAAAGLAVLASTALAQPPVSASPAVIDGPTSSLSGLGLSVARDGTGGLVYLKIVSGAPHVFVSQLSGGSFQAPVQVDAGLSSASSQPVIAAGNGGLLLVAFINAGALYVMGGSQAGQFGAPLRLAGGAVNPAIAITSFGKAYLAFASADGAGHDIRSAYYVNGGWTVVSPVLNSAGPDDAGTGAGRPAVAAAGDGIALVAWGEHGHIYSRRVWGTTPSVVEEQADAPLPGCTEGSVADPVAGVGGTSSYVPVAFQEQLTCGGQQQSRVLVNRLHGSVYDGVTPADGLSTPSSDGANDPQIAATETGQGWVTSARTNSEDAFAAWLSTNGVPTGSLTALNSVPEAAAPYPVPAAVSLSSTLVAWQQVPGSSGGGDIRVRYGPSGGPLGPETVVSAPAQGPTDAADGLVADGDGTGDAAVAWVQGAPGALQLVADQLYQPPGGFAPAVGSPYVTNSQPVLSWTRPAGWGPMTYSVRVDGTQVAQTGATSFQVPAPLADGPHHWQVTATNPAGQQSQAPAASVFVDTTPPTGGLRLFRGKPATQLRALVTYGDHAPPGEPAYDASGVSGVLIRWGDGSVTHVRWGVHHLTHVYRRRGRYRIILLVVDRAGNVTRVVRVVKVAPPKHARRKRH